MADRATANQIKKCAPNGDSSVKSAVSLQSDQLAADSHGERQLFGESNRDAARASI